MSSDPIHQTSAIRPSISTGKQVEEMTVAFNEFFQKHFPHRQDIKDIAEIFFIGGAMWEAGRAASELKDIMKSL